MNFEKQVDYLINDMAKPINSLGLLEKHIKKVLCCWGKVQTELKPFHLIFAADNGITEEGVVKQPIEITRLQAQNMAAGKATISCFCASNHIPYKVVDVGIHSIETAGVNCKVAQGTKNFLQEEAMTRQEFQKAFQVGKDMVALAKAEGYNLLSFGEMGIGNTTTSSAVLHALTNVAPEFLIGYGANPTNPEVIKRKREVVSAGVALHKSQMKTPEDIIRCVGGFDIAAICGGMIECMYQKLPFAIDGFITAVAFACAVRIEPKVADYGIPSHMSREPGMEYALSLGKIKSVDVPIRADLALGEGTGAIFMVVMLRTMLYAVQHTAKLSEMPGQDATEVRTASEIQGIS